MNRPYKIKALLDYPNGGMVRRGEIGIYDRERIYDFPSQSGYIVSDNLIGKNYEIVQMNKENEPTYEIY